MVTSGFEAAKATIGLMRATFTKIPPIKIVNAFVAHQGGGAGRAKYMWGLFGEDTIKVMQSGTHLLAVLWESAWNRGQGERRIKTTASLTPKAAMRICQDPNFLPSVTIDKIGPLLKQPEGVGDNAESTSPQKKSRSRSKRLSDGSSKTGHSKGRFKHKTNP
jgi:hypothetical protein